MYLQGQKVWITLLHLWIHKTNNNNNNNKTTKIHETKMQSLEMYMEESCLLVYVLCLSSTVTIATVLDWKWIHFEKSIQVILSQSMGGGGACICRTLTMWMQKQEHQQWHFILSTDHFTDLLLASQSECVLNITI